MANEDVVREDAGTGSEPVWKQRGFDSEQAMDREFGKAKDDIRAMKARVRELEAKAAKADEYESKANEQAQREMSELDKAKKAAADFEAKVTDYQVKLQAKERELVYERTVSSRFAGKAEDEVKWLRRVYDAEALRGFETPEELIERLDAIDADWAASRAPKKEERPNFSRPAAPGAVTPPPQTGKAGQLDDSTFDSLNERLRRGPSRGK